MIRFLADYCYWYGPLRVFDSITFRAMFGMALAFAVIALSGERFIRFLHSLQITEDVSKPHSETLASLHAKKVGTPTMGGLLIMVGMAACMLLVCDPTASALLRSSDIVDAGAFCQQVTAPGVAGQVTPAGRVWSCLTEDGQAVVKGVAASDGRLDPDARHRLATAINALLVQKDFYEPECFARVALPGDVVGMVRVGPERLLFRHLHEANRKILSACFPELLAPPRSANPFVWMGVTVLVAFGLIGAADDYMKLRGLGRQGLSKRQKFLAQCGVAALTAAVFSIEADSFSSTRLLLPFTKWAQTQPDMGILYYGLFALVIVACSNAVNLTDGLDGLASGCTIMVCLTYTVLAYIVGNAVMCTFFRIPHVAGSGELAIYCAVMVGAVMGFLWFNAHPAEVFMGDTGSLALGAGIGFVALVIKHEFVLLLAGGIFVVEAASVLIQVVSFRLTGRRVFKCAPFHHHLEFSGWHENKVVVRLWIVGAILSVLALATLKMH